MLYDQHQNALEWVVSFSKNNENMDTLNMAVGNITTTHVNDNESNGQ